MKRLSVIVILVSVLFAAATAEAQYLSDNGLFEVDVIRGCPGTTIQITNLYTATCDCLAGCSCDFDYNGDGNFEVKTMPFEYTYDTEGVYRLEILFSGTSDFITITIEDKAAPEFNLFTCAAETVQAEITDTNYEAYEIDYGDGTIITVNQGDPVPSHTYADATPRTVTVRGLDAGSANNCPVTTRDITPLATLPAPVINAITPVDATSLSLDLSTSENILYDLQMSVNGGTYNTIETYTSSVASRLIDGLDLSTNYYCFQLVARDPCGGADAPSTTACSILLDLTPGNSAAILNWETGMYTSDVSIFRDGTLLATEPNGTVSYTDPNLTCGVTYCYQVSVLFSGTISYSLPVCVDGNSDTGPPPIIDLSVSVTSNGQADLLWYIDEPLVPPAIYEGFEVYRTGENAVPENIANVTQTAYLDDDVRIPAAFTYCYEIIPRDYCGNRTPANIIACAIVPEGFVNREDEVNIQWSPYTGYSGGVREYIVEKAYADGTFSEVSRVQDTVFTEMDNNPDSQILMYRITAVPEEDGIRSSVSSVIILTKSSNLFYPDAFSPDGDDLNDTFEVNGRFIAEYEMMIFSRWGELIFRTTDISEAWDGTFNGENVQEGTYAMKIRVTDEAGREIKREGSIVIVRR